MSTFREEVDFLQQHTRVVVLDSRKPAMVAVTPDWQGRVITSAPGGWDGPAQGWINRDFITAGKRGAAFDNYGGEDRFWVGPEGGQFALWFKKGERFDLPHWKTPPGFNTGRFDVTSEGKGSVALASQFDLVNRAGGKFEVAVKRIIDVLNRDRVAETLGLTMPAGVSLVAFQSSNTLANVGKTAWSREGGLLSAWTLGQFNALPRGLVIVPFHPGPPDQLGPFPNGEYFGKIGPHRFSVHDHYCLFRCDGRFRSKLGVSARRAKRVLGSFDPDSGILTVVQFNLPSGAAKLPYVNSLWEQQKEPFAGDVVNSYNDGPVEGGSPPLGAFYELETSSPAAELAPEQAITHVHRTFHFSGTFEAINRIATQVLGVDMAGIKFP